MRLTPASVVVWVVAVGVAPATGAATTAKCRRETLRDGALVYDIAATRTTCSTAKTVVKPAGVASISGKEMIHARPRYRSHGFACTASGTFVSVGIANWIFDCWHGTPDAATTPEITFQVTFPHGYKG